MIYNGSEIKKLGFGFMRLPMLDEVNVDLEQVKEMVDIFLENGFTYFDTAYGYHDQKSEGYLKEALIDRYPRESFQVATKLPAWYKATSKEEAEEMFYTSLKRTGAGYFDFYLLHNLGKKRTDVFENYDLWNFISERKKEGLIKNIGFSLHDNAEALDKILTKHPEVDFVQLQINYADWNDLTVQSKLCYEVAMKHGKKVIIMEPIRGGSLANPPTDILNALYLGNPTLTPAAWALKFASNLENVITVLSGMSTISQVQENVETLKDVIPFTDEEKKAILDVQQIIKDTPSIPCTGCAYCVEGCPSKINIPGVLSAMNRKIVYSDPNAVTSYKFATGNGALASDCIACGLCESVCPQLIPIVNELNTIADVFDK